MYQYRQDMWLFCAFNACSRWYFLTIKQLGHFFFKLSFNFLMFFYHACNILVWNWSNSMNSWSTLWCGYWMPGALTHSTSPRHTVLTFLCFVVFVVYTSLPNPLIVLHCNSTAVEVWEWISNCIPHFTGVWLLIQAAIKVNPTCNHQKTGSTEKVSYLHNTLTYNNDKIVTRKSHSRSGSKYIIELSSGSFQKSFQVLRFYSAHFFLWIAYT